MVYSLQKLMQIKLAHISYLYSSYGILCITFGATENFPNGGFPRKIEVRQYVPFLSRVCKILVTAQIAWAHSIFQ